MAVAFDAVLALVVVAVGTLLLLEAAWFLVPVTRVRSWIGPRAWTLMLAATLAVCCTTISLHYIETVKIRRDISGSEDAYLALSTRLLSPACAELNLGTSALMPPHIHRMIDLAKHGIQVMLPVGLGLQVGLLAVIFLLLGRSVRRGTQSAWVRSACVTLLIFVVFTFLGATVITDAFRSLQSDVANSDSIGIQIATGQIPCTTFQVENGTAVASDACDADYNTTECFFPVSMLLAKTLPLGYPNTTTAVSQTINVSQPFNHLQEPEWDSVLADACTNGTDGSPTLETLVCRLQTDTTTLLFIDAARYTRLTQAMSYGVVLTVAALILATDMATSIPSPAYTKQTELRETFM